MDIGFLGPWIPLILEAIGLTLVLSAASLVGAGVIGLAVAIARVLGGRLVSAPLGVVVDLIRGTPLLVQMLIWFLAPAKLGLSLDPVPAAILALSVNGGAFLSEIIRGALGGVPKGQREAATAIGLGRVYTLRAILLPQAMPVIVPSAISFYIGLVKDTSIAYILGVHELLRTSQLVTMQEFHPMEIYTVAAAIYFVICFPLSRLALQMEARMRRSGMVQERLAV